MAVVVAIAINLTVMRSFNESKPDSLAHLFFACGVMPMASVLFLIAVFSAPSLLRGNGFWSFALGFEAFGWAAIFAFVTLYSIVPSALLTFTEWIGQLIERHWRRHSGRAATPRKHANTRQRD